jgi:osmoprotectant transport system ATP-binding protein
MAATAVEFAGVSYILPNGQALLRDINLKLEAGTTTAILGRSGSGKTTLLRMVNGLVQPTSGRVLVGGKSAVEDVLALRRSIGYVIQETGLFPHMTIERNVTMPLELANVDAAEKQRRGAEILSLVGLEFQSFRARYPWQLSGGQRQRVGLARALASDPEVLLMDEPFGALDPLTRAEMQSMLRDLLAKVQKTVLLVTHDLPEALYLGQRLIFVDAGQIVADLPSTNVFSSENPHVRRYVETLERTLPTNAAPAAPTGASPSAPSPS